MQVNIRLYHPSDESQLVELWQQIFDYPEARNEPRAVIQKKLTYDGRLLVALRDGRLVGSLMFGYDGHRGWLYRLAVRSDSRREGIARALVTKAEEQLLELGCTKINLQLFQHNEDAARFWEAAGYAREARISMGKDLTGTRHDRRDTGC